MKGYRTIIVQLIMGLLSAGVGIGVLDPAIPADQAAAAVTDTSMALLHGTGWAGFAWAVVNAILRAVTTTPLGKKE